jgi:hypothetical protein
MDRADLTNLLQWCLDEGRLALANGTLNAHPVQAYGKRLLRSGSRSGWAAGLARVRISLAGMLGTL